MDDENDWGCSDHDVEAEIREFGAVATALNTFEGDPNCSNATPRSPDLLLSAFSSSHSESGDAQQRTQLGADTLDHGVPSLQSHFTPFPQSSSPMFRHGTASSTDPAFSQVSAGPLQNWEPIDYEEFDFLLGQQPSHEPGHERNSTGSYGWGWPTSPSNPPHESLASAASSRDAWKILTPKSSSNGTSSALTDFVNVSHPNDVSSRVDSQQVRHYAKAIAPKPRLYPDRVNQTVGVGIFTPVLGATAPELPPQQSSLCSKQWVVPSSGKRKRLDDDARRKIRKLREMGACIRCRMLNLKVCRHSSCGSPSR
jgi:hypothetical protein